MSNLTTISSPMPGGPRPSRLTRRQKAAIVVRLLLNEGADLSFADFPEDLQASLTQTLGSMRMINRETLEAVVGEFATELEEIGLSFPRGLAGALGQMDGRISPQTAARLRREAGVRQMGDPWTRIRAQEVDDLLEILDQESIEVAAVVLSKLDTGKAAAILGKLPGDRARILTYAVSQTGAVTPDAVDRIGLALAAQIADVPEKAFDDSPERRVGAILNLSASATRDSLLEGLAEEDVEFAERVRKAIFTYRDIPARIDTADIGKLTRAVGQIDLVTALRYGADLGGPDAEASEFILTNISKRMADGLREEMEALGKVKTKLGEEAANTLIAAIRDLESTGELTLRIPDAEED